VIEAVKRQMDLGTHYGSSHELEVRWAELVCELIPSAEKVRFTASGTEADMMAVRLARAYTGRDMIAICADHPFFSTDDWFIGTTAMNSGIPEAIRQLTANGAEVLARVSAYMDPWGTTEPMNWWTIVNRCRALENLVYVVAANQGATLRHYPPYSWPGGSQIVDFDGRLLAEATPGPGERIVVAPIDVSALRHEREVRRGHHMVAQLRTEAYPVYGAHRYPPAPTTAGARSYEQNIRLIDQAKRLLPT
jgi:hypothetical protein